MISIRNLLFVLILPTAIACGKAGSSAAEIMASPEQKKSDSVKGPELVGKWESKCALASPGKYVKLSYVFKGNNVTRSEDIYENSYCSRVLDYRVQGGTYRFVDKHAGDVLEVEFNLASASGFVIIKENILRKGQKMLVSFRSAGSGVIPNIELNRTDAPAEDVDGGSSETTFAPRVGQKVAYYQTTNRGTKTITFEIVSASSAQGPWKLKKSTQHHDEGYTEDVTQPMNFLTSSQFQKESLNTCAANGGVRETITVSAGTFDTCRTGSGGELTWTGLVPIYGVIKSKSMDGSTTELKSFTL